MTCSSFKNKHNLERSILGNDLSLNETGFQKDEFGE